MRKLIVLIVPVMLAGLLGGCYPSPKVVTDESYAEFVKAGPFMPEVDKSQLTLARVPSDIYKVVPGDVLELEMPSVLLSSEPVSVDEIGTYRFRVDKQGNVTLPVVGQIKVVGNDLTQIEKQLTDLFYPQYTNTPPSIVAGVSEYYTQSVSVTGAVANPGQYKLKSDEMSLVSAIMAAGGIDAEGAGVITVTSAATGGQAGTTRDIALPVKGLNVPFADIALTHGDVVEVKRLNPEIFSVIGLVQRPGSFPYTPGSRYNVLQALAFAGGPDDSADPKYIKVFRQKADGQLIDATFKLDEQGIVNANNVDIRPGDIVVAVKTNQTQWNEFMDDFFSVRANVGMDVRYLNRYDY